VRLFPSVSALIDMSPTLMDFILVLGAGYGSRSLGERQVLTASCAAEAVHSERVDIISSRLAGSVIRINSL